MKFNNKFSNFLYAGILLLSSCIIGAGISSVNIYSDQYLGSLLVPKIISYILIFIGVSGHFNIFDYNNKKKNGLNNK